MKDILAGDDFAVEIQLLMEHRVLNWTRINAEGRGFTYSENSSNHRDAERAECDVKVAAPMEQERSTVLVSRSYDKINR